MSALRFRHRLHHRWARGGPAADAAPLDRWGRRLLSPVLGALRFLRLLRLRIVRHGLPAESARLAYFGFLAIFPAILVLFALTGLFGGEAAFHWIMAQIEAALPDDAASFLARFVFEVTGSFRPGALSFGLLLMVWSSSLNIAVLTHALNQIFGLEERRRWWRRRGFALLFQFGGMLAIFVAATMVLAGPLVFGERLLGEFWARLRWPTVVGTVVAVTWFLYAFLPNWSEGRAKRRLLAGAVVAALLWALTTEGFRLYVTHYGRYSRVYGFVAAVIIMQIWMYLSALCILIGAEVAALLLPATPDRETEAASGPEPPASAASPEVPPRLG